MRRNIIISAIVLLLGVSSCSKVKRPLSETDAYRMYVETLDSFANAVPVIGNDSVSIWASTHVHRMAADIRENQYELPELMARVARMQDYAAYGMSYVSASIGTYADGKACADALSIISRSDSLFSAIGSEGFNNQNRLMDYSFTSYYHMQLFLHLLDLILPKEHRTLIYDDSNFGFSLKCINSIKNMQMARLYTDQELMRLIVAVENVAFFNTVSPLTMAFASSQRMFEHNRGVIQKTADFFDHYAGQVFDSPATSEVLQMTDSQYAEFFSKSMAYRCLLLRIASTEVTLMKK
ncbi:MAG: hypothetical protein MJY79_05040 [Bacteroidaceae bacterium]|nr:hypothetical protein [Bacteroidaceae bacterium]